MQWLPLLCCCACFSAGRLCRGSACIFSFAPTITACFTFRLHHVLNNCWLSLSRLVHVCVYMYVYTYICCCLPKQICNDFFAPSLFIHTLQMKRKSVCVLVCGWLGGRTHTHTHDKGNFWRKWKLLSVCASASVSVCVCI